jgi:hypothetical protein
MICDKRDLISQVNLARPTKPAKPARDRKLDYQLKNSFAGASGGKQSAHPLFGGCQWASVDPAQRNVNLPPHRTTEHKKSLAAWNADQSACVQWLRRT